MSRETDRLIADRGHRRLPCGSLRKHDAHDWTGQATGVTFHCSGVPPTFPERSDLADQRLREETAGITDNWREDAP